MSTSRTRLLKSIRYLLSVVICVFVVVCASGQSIIPQPFANLSSDGLVYNSTFQYKSHYVSGLLAVKKENDGYHVVVLSKLGPSIMDFIITEDEVIWKKVVPELNKPLLLKTMERDFRTLLLTPLDHPKKIRTLRSHRYKIRNNILLKVKTSDDNKRIISAETKRFVNLFKAFVKYFYTNDDGIPDEIRLRHRTIKLKIELNQLEL